MTNDGMENGIFAQPHSLTRRSVLAGAAAVGALAGLGVKNVSATTDLVLMAWQGYDIPFKSGTFLKDNDAELATTFVNTSGEIITKLQTGGEVDLVTLIYGRIPLLAAAGLLEPIDVKTPGLEKVFQRFMDVETLHYDGKLYALPFSWGLYPMLYDPQAIAAPTSWKDVLKDEYKGKVAMADDIIALIPQWTKIVTGTKTPTLINKDELKQTIDVLIKIKKEHARTFSPNFGEVADLFARGEVVISANGYDATVGFAKAKGKTIAYTIPAEGATCYLDTVSVPVNSKNKELALKAAVHSVSGPAQAAMAKQLTQGVISQDAVPLVDQSNRDFYQYDNIDKFLEKASFYPYWPFESDGKHVTFEEMQEEYARFLQA